MMYMALRFYTVFFLCLILQSNKNYAQQKPAQYANNIPIPVIRNSDGVFADAYSFSKDNLYKKINWKGMWIWLNKQQFSGYQGTRTTWINPGMPYEKPYRALFRKQITLNTVPQQPVIFITADVRFHLYINDSLVADGPVNTGSDYGDEHAPDYCYYTTCDIKRFLKKGTNTIAVEVLSMALEGSETTGSFGKFICDIQDGEKIILASDTSWKAIADTAYSNSDGYLVYNADKNSETWKQQTFDDHAWPFASLQPMADSTRLFQSNIPSLLHYPVAPVQIFKGNIEQHTIADRKQFYSEQSAGEYILDFSRVIVGYVCFSITANKGDTIEVIPYEKIKPVAGPAKRYRYICAEGRNDFRSSNLSSFRYLLVRLHTTKRIGVNTFSPEFATYPVQYKGAFTCSNDFYNQLWSISRYTTQLCMSDMFFDSPMHQEPIGCTGDYFIESMNNYYAFGDQWLTRQNLMQTAQMMRKNDYKMFHTSYSLLWVQMLRQYVWYTGDTSILHELLPDAHQLMNRFKTYLNKDHLVAEAPNYMFMDWINIKGFNAHHPPAMIGTGYMSALLYKALIDIDSMSTFVTTKQVSYAMLADSIKQGINALLWDEQKQLYKDGIPFNTHVKPNEWMPADTNFTTYSAHVNTLAVLYGIAPVNKEAAIMNYIATQNEYELQPYFMSYVLQAAKKTNHIDVGLELINRWKNGIDTSTYTLKENWQDQTSFGYGGDFSHAWGGSPLRYLSQNVLGIAPGKAGYAMIEIHPYTGEKIDWARGAVPVNDKDVVAIWWEKKDGEYTFEYAIPAKRNAVYHVPEGFKKYSIMVDGKKETTWKNAIVLKPGKHVIQFK
jgi:alpha-L-rhamnosidase